MSSVFEARRPVALPGKILVVDDDSTCRRMLIDVLEACAYQPIAAASGPEALEAFFTHRPAMVLLDVFLPRMSGIEVLARLRESREGKRVPVIMMSAAYDPEGCAQVSGRYVTYVSKPFSFVDMLDHVERLWPSQRPALLPPDPDDHVFSR